MVGKYREEKYIKVCLANALVELMKTYRFDEITVNEICYAAHVGRATFYHYANGKQGKAELLDFKLERDYDLYVAKRRANGLSKTDGAGDTFSFVYDNRETFSLLHRDQLNNTLIHFLLYAEGDPNTDGDQAYIDAYLALGHLGILQQWYRDGYRKSAFEVAQILFNKHADLVMRHVKLYLELNQRKE